MVPVAGNGGDLEFTGGLNGNSGLTAGEDNCRSNNRNEKNKGTGDKDNFFAGEHEQVDIL